MKLYRVDNDGRDKHPSLDVVKSELLALGMLVFDPTRCCSCREGDKGGRGP